MSFGSSRSTTRIAPASLLLLLLAGCSSLAETPPANFNLTGVWQLNSALSDSPSLAGARAGSRGNRGGASGQGSGPEAGGRNGGRGGQRGAGGQGRPNGQSRPQSGARGARQRGGSRNVPTLSAQQIKIEQDFESMGMEFDGKNYRDVSWGTRKRGELTIESGWEQRDLLIRTKGGRMKVEERYALSDDGNRLTAYIELDGGRHDLSFKRVYQKVVAN